MYTHMYVHLNTVHGYTGTIVSRGNVIKLFQDAEYLESPGRPNSIEIPINEGFCEPGEELVNIGTCG